MKVKFYNPAELDRNIKASIHNTGKLGFTFEAANKLKLSEFKSMLIGRNEEDPTDENLYVVINDARQEGAFNVNKAGKYYYINTKALFDTFQWDYTKYSIIFNITPSQYEGSEVYIFKKKQKLRDGEDE